MRYGNIIPIEMFYIKYSRMSSFILPTVTEYWHLLQFKRLFHLNFQCQRCQKSPKRHVTRKKKKKRFVKILDSLSFSLFHSLYVCIKCIKLDGGLFEILVIDKRFYSISKNVDNL